MKKLTDALNAIEGFEVVGAELMGKKMWHIDITLDQWDHDAERTMSVWKRFEKVCEDVEDLGDKIVIQIIPTMIASGELTFSFIGNGITPTQFAKAIK